MLEGAMWIVMVEKTIDMTQHWNYMIQYITARYLSTGYIVTVLFMVIKIISL